MQTYNDQLNEGYGGLSDGMDNPFAGLMHEFNETNSYLHSEKQSEKQFDEQSEERYEKHYEGNNDDEPTLFFLDLIQEEIEADILQAGMINA